MCFFRKRSTVEKNSSDTNLIISNAGQLSVIEIYINEMSDDIKNQFEELKRKADFAPTSPKPEVEKTDKKIAREISELKLKLATEKATESKVKAVLRSLQVLYAERDAIYFTKD